MELQDTLLKEFASAINKETEDSGNGKTVYAKVSRVVDDTVYIIIDGSTEETPATTMVEIGVNDRVFATIKSHSVVVTGNISYPSLTRVGEAYITMVNGGLVVGFLDDENNPYGNRLFIGKADDKTASFSVVDPDGIILASFGSTTTIGSVGSAHVTMTGSAITFLDSAGKTLATFGANVRIGTHSSTTSDVYIQPDSITIYNKGKDVASFGSTVRIGPTNGARVTIGDGIITIYRNSTAEVFKAGLIDVPTPGVADMGTHTKPPTTSASGQSVTGNLVATGTLWSYKPTGGEARVAVGSYGDSDNYAEGYLLANGNGRFGIYDSLHKKWVVNTEPDGVYSWVRIAGRNPSALRTTVLNAPSAQNTYAQATISDLIYWNAVIVWGTVDETTLPLIFVRGDDKEAYIAQKLADGTNKGGFHVDWAGNHVEVRWLYRISSYYTIRIDKVYGFMPR